MSLEIVEIALQRTCDSRFVSDEFTVVWHAGEPLAAGITFYERAGEIIAKRSNLSGVKIYQSIQTNGTLITKSWCELFKKYNVRVGISVDGPASIHDLHRKTRQGTGSHGDVLRGMKLLRDAGIDYHAICVLSEDSLKSCDEILEFFQKMEVHHIAFNIEEEEGVHRSSSLRRSNTRERAKLFFEKCLEVAKGSNPKLYIREIDTAEKSIIHWTPQRATVSRIFGGQENSPFKIISVDYEGNFSTFSPELIGTQDNRYDNFLFGNVLRQSFEDALKKDSFKRMWSAIQSGVSKCRSECKYFDYCGGGSPSNKFFEHGRFDTTETMHCLLHKKTLIDAVLAALEKA